MRHHFSTTGVVLNLLELALVNGGAQLRSRARLADMEHIRGTNVRSRVPRYTAHLKVPRSPAILHFLGDTSISGNSSHKLYLYNLFSVIAAHFVIHHEDD